MRNFFIWLGVVVCLTFAGERLYRFYESHKPVLQKGECVVFETEDSLWFCQSLETKLKSSVLECVIFNKAGLLSGTEEFTHDELREAKAQKVVCNE
jgi:hypothetical protein